MVPRGIFDTWNGALKSGAAIQRFCVPVCWGKNDGQYQLIHHPLVSSVLITSLDFSNTVLMSLQRNGFCHHSIRVYFTRKITDNPI